jgi:YjbE family integral membrane protein
MGLELFSAAWFQALLAIIVIDLILAGDNAIVIALAARSLPPKYQRRAVVWGTVGAIIVRAAMTVVVVWLLTIPGLKLAGGLLLVWIAVKLLMPQDEGGNTEHAAATSFWGAMKTIVIADAVMGLDNVLAVGGAAQGDYLLVILGLLISIPIVVWGSTIILKWIERFPVIVYFGAGVLAWTAVKMMTTEQMLAAVLAGRDWMVYSSYVVVIAGTIAAGWSMNKRKSMQTLARADA